ncbi:hypothetical protein BGZ74_002924 [Mortierella antarctica]|nr:hypothetical protein BGZ74_002924 [Mortierella antarctica]
MKILFSALLISTLAIASLVAAQETQQIGVKASAPAAPNMESKKEEALWNDDKQHHKFNKFKQCPTPKPVIIALPIPESQYECKKKCEYIEKEREEACELGQSVCKSKCVSAEDCQGLCTTAESCQAECVASADRDCESECNDYIGSEKECWSKCKRDCGSVCERSCKRCNAEAYAADASKMSTTDATVSEHEQPVVPAPAAL